MPKLHYSTDALNRLLVRRDEEIYPLEGSFKVERNFLLFVPERKASLLTQLNLPQRLKFEGSWHLDENYDLKLTLIETKTQTGDEELKIHGKIISAEANQLIFQTHCKKGRGSQMLSLLHLEGRWQADEFNQLQFLVAKDVEEDILKFSGGWQINRNQKIIYKYEKQDLLRKTRTEEHFLFFGYWDIDAANRLTYVLDLKNRSFFEFRVQLESPELRAKQGEIRYRLGIGVRELREGKVISLFGQWKIGPRRDIFFEIDYGQDNLQKIIFGAKVLLNQNNQLIFELENKKCEDLGLAVIFTRDFLEKDAQVFARLVKLEKDLRVEAGLRITW